MLVLESRLNSPRKAQSPAGTAAFPDTSQENAIKRTNGNAGIVAHSVTLESIAQTTRRLCGGRGYLSSGGWLWSASFVHAAGSTRIGPPELTLLLLVPFWLAPFRLVRLEAESLSLSSVLVALFERGRSRIHADGAYQPAGPVLDTDPARLLRS
ncbi:hypothetical protein BJX66DRAFT_331792 [Aspergillus keveii]|uniref:Uncharacterized protein n=1 Tax=Aspergillus keveii TaxID=714993 RepID=A0ABR4GPQ7_9EURO